MTWTKLSDDFADDCWTLSDSGFRLHVEGLTWSNRKLVDLRISKDDVRRFAKHPEAAQELVDKGYWEDDGDHYLIRHHAIYQRSREAVQAQQAANAQNGKRGGRPKKPPREQAQETQSLSESLTDSKSERDRTGRDGLNTQPPTEEAVAVEERTGEVIDMPNTGHGDWPAESDLQDTCRVCGMGLEWPLARRFAICKDKHDQKHETARAA